MIVDTQRQRNANGLDAMQVIELAPSFPSIFYVGNVVLLCTPCTINYFDLAPVLKIIKKRGLQEAYFYSNPA